MKTSSLKFWRSLSFILIVINVGILILLLNQSSPIFKLRHPHEGGPGKFIVEKLKLNTEQIDQFEILKKSHQKSMRDLNQEGKYLREVYFSGLKSNQVNHQSDSVLNLILENQKEKEQVTFNHFREVKNICNETQKTIFDTILNEILAQLKSFTPPPPPQR